MRRKLCQKLKLSGYGDYHATCPCRWTIDDPFAITSERRKCMMHGKVERPVLLSDTLNTQPFWIGQSQYINPTLASPLAFNLSLDDNEYGVDQSSRRAEDNDNRLMEMLAAQAAHREEGSTIEDEDAIASNAKLSDDEKRLMLQKALHMASSNGDIERVQRLVDGSSKNYVDINGADEEGTAPLIYASCFVSMKLLACYFVQMMTLYTGTPRCSLGSA